LVYPEQQTFLGIRVMKQHKWVNYFGCGVEFRV